MKLAKTSNGANRQTCQKLGVCKSCVLCVQPPISLLKKEIVECRSGYRSGVAKTPNLHDQYILHKHKVKGKHLLTLTSKKSRRLIEAIAGRNNLCTLQTNTQNEIKKTDLPCRLREEMGKKISFRSLFNKYPCLRQARQDHLKLNKIIQSHNWTIQGVLKNQ